MLCRPYRAFSIIIFAALIYLLLQNLPAPPKTENNNRADRPPPPYYVESKPRFLHQSPFRKTPDVEYEGRLSAALQDIEKSTLALLNGDDSADPRIWQIFLGKDAERGSDSILFEQRNKEWEYFLVTNQAAIEFLTSIFSTIPDIENIYRQYPYHVLRADLLRYLLLWYYGGFYADMDVFPAKPILACSALQPLLDRNLSLILGIEIDEPFASPRLMRDWHWSRSYGFIQYTMFAPRRFSPFLREVIVRVLAHTKQHIEQNTGLFSSPTYAEKTILEITGPGVFTDAVLDVLSRSLQPTHELVKVSMGADEGVGELATNDGERKQERVTWAPFHRITEPVCVDGADDLVVGVDAHSATAPGGLCVLPISVWGNGQRHSNAGGFNSEHACVNHRFGRTWKKGWWEYLWG